MSEESKEALEERARIERELLRQLKGMAAGYLALQEATRAVIAWERADAERAERARVVAWLRDLPTRGHLADRGSEPISELVEWVEWTRTRLALAIERGEHDEARAGGTQEPRSGGEGET